MFVCIPSKKVRNVSLFVFILSTNFRLGKKWRTNSQIVRPFCGNKKKSFVSPSSFYNKIEKSESFFSPLLNIYFFTFTNFRITCSKKNERISGSNLIKTESLVHSSLKLSCLLDWCPLLQVYQQTITILWLVLLGCKLKYFLHFWPQIHYLIKMKNKLIKQFKEEKG